MPEARNLEPKDTLSTRSSQEGSHSIEKWQAEWEKERNENLTVIFNDFDEAKIVDYTRFLEEVKKKDDNDKKLALRAKWDQYLDEYQKKHPVGTAKEFYAANTPDGIIEKIKNKQSLEGVYATSVDMDTVLNTHPNILKEGFKQAGSYLLTTKDSGIYKGEIEGALKQSQTIAGRIQLYIPVSFAQAHWCLAEIEMEHGKLVTANMYDSLQTAFTNAQNHFEKCIKEIDSSFKAEYIVERVQQNGHSCGDYVLAACAKKIQHEAPLPDFWQGLKNMNLETTNAEDLRHTIAQQIAKEKKLSLGTETKHQIEDSAKAMPKALKPDVSAPAILEPAAQAILPAKPQKDKTYIDRTEYLHDVQNEHEKFVAKLSTKYSKNSTSDQCKVILEQPEQDELLARLLLKEYLLEENDEKAFANAEKKLNELTVVGLSSQVFFKNVTESQTISDAARKEEMFTLQA